MLIDITYPLTNWGWTSSSCSTKWLFMSSDCSGSRRLATSIKIQTFELHSTWVFTGKLSLALLNRSKACNHYVLLSLLMVNLTNWQQVEPRAIGKWFHGKVWKILMTFLWSIRQGFSYFTEKKQNFAGFSGANSRKNHQFRGIFAGKKSKFVEKSADFVGFSLEKSQNLQKNQPTSREFSRKKSNFEGFSWANS